jgi:Flp pilus assembly protein TadB
MSDAVKNAKEKTKKMTTGYRKARRNLRAAMKYGTNKQQATCQDRHDKWKAKMDAAKDELKKAREENPSKWGTAAKLTTAVVVIIGLGIGVASMMNGNGEVEPATDTV